MKRFVTHILIIIALTANTCRTAFAAESIYGPAKKPEKANPIGGSGRVLVRPGIPPQNLIRPPVPPTDAMGNRIIYGGGRVIDTSPQSRGGAPVDRGANFQVSPGQRVTPSPMGNRIIYTGGKVIDTSPRSRGVAPIDRGDNFQVNPGRTIAASFGKLSESQGIPVLASEAQGGLERIVGTWRKRDNSMVEFKTDQTIVAEDKVIGKWRLWPDSGHAHLYIVTFQGNVIQYKAAVDRYQRNLNLAHPGTNYAIVLARVDGGPTVNPDVPTETVALNMERRDLQNAIEASEASFLKTKNEAAEEWQRHFAARAAGKISGHSAIAQKKDQEALLIGGSLKNLRSHLESVEQKLADR